MASGSSVSSQSTSPNSVSHSFKSDKKLLGTGHLMPYRTLWNTAITKTDIDDHINMEKQLKRLSLNNMKIVRFGDRIIIE